MALNVLEYCPIFSSDIKTSKSKVHNHYYVISKTIRLFNWNRQHCEKGMALPKVFGCRGSTSKISYRIELLQTSSIQDEMWHLKWFVQITHHHLTPGIYIHYTLKSLNMENQWTIQIPTPNYASEVSLIKYMFLTRYVYYILFKNRCQFEIVVHHDIGMSLIAHLQLLLVKWDETNWSEKNALTSVVMGDFWLLL